MRFSRLPPASVHSLESRWSASAFQHGVIGRILHGTVGLPWNGASDAGL